MARHSLPGSLELLLDTMCNTFGGVMFIAISMVITLMVAQQKLTPESQREAEKKLLEARRRENLLLLNSHKNAKNHLNRLKQMAMENQKSSASALPAQVARLKQDLKDVSREIEMLAEENAILTEKCDKLAKENRAKESEVRKKQQEYAARRQTLEHKNALLHEQLKHLQIQLSNTPVKQLHFARDEHTDRSPYLMIIENGLLYRVGEASLDDCSDVTFQNLSESRIRIIPRHGVMLSAIQLRNIDKYLSALDPQRHFAWIMVHPRMLASFVPFRRMLRGYGCKVYWYVESDYIVIRSASASYSASD